jgi:hypothetical protein
MTGIIINALIVGFITVAIFYGVFILHKPSLGIGIFATAFLIVYIKTIQIISRIK